MWNYLKQKQTKILVGFLLLASVGAATFIVVGMDKNDKKETASTRQVEGEMEVDDVAEVADVSDGYQEPLGVNESSEPAYEQNTSAVNPSVINTPVSFAAATTTNIVIEIEPAREETPIQVVKAENPTEQIVAVDTSEKHEGKTRSFEGAVSVPSLKDVNEEEEARRAEEVRRAEEEAKKAEEEAKALAEAEEKAKAEEAARIEAEERAKAELEQAEEEAREKAEEEARKAEEARIQAEEEARKAEEARIQAEEEARRKAEEEARVLAEAEALEQMLHSEHYEGNVFSGANTYPWQNDCPDKQDYYLTYLDGHKIGGYVCECVSYAGWKAYAAWGIPLGWGNAYSWDDGARADGRFYVDHTPAAKTIGQANGGTYGHVFWVESVNPDGSVNVTEYNNAYATKLYSGVYRYGDFGARTISANEAGNYNYIHLR